MEDSFNILYEGEFQHFLFYVYQLREQGYDVDFHEVNKVAKGKKYVVYQEEVMESLGERFELREKEELMEGIYLLKID
jgi:hypothetical protein